MRFPWIRWICCSASPANSSMDVVYLCRAGKNEELRYSLRSLRNLQHDRVWVVGGRPSWFDGDYLRVPPSHNKYQHGRLNLQKIVDTAAISDPFVLFNDDFFVVRKISAIPTLHAGSLYQFIKTFRSYAPKARYTAMLETTYRVLKEQKVSAPIAYNLHVPMVMWKDHLRYALRFEGSPRSLVGNLFKYGGRKASDVKVHRRLPGSPPSYDWLNGSAPFFSTDDHTFPEVWEGKLREMFPERSPFER